VIDDGSLIHGLKKDERKDERKDEKEHNTMRKRYDPSAFFRFSFFCLNMHTFI
jgi:hypothetical protein